MDECTYEIFSSLDTATVSDSEAKGSGRRRRRTTGGSDVGEDVEKAKRLGYSSEQNGNPGQALSRQQIVSMVKKRFGLKNGDGSIPGDNVANGAVEEPPVRLQ